MKGTEIKVPQGKITIDKKKKRRVYSRETIIVNQKMERISKQRLLTPIIIEKESPINILSRYARIRLKGEEYTVPIRMDSDALNPLISLRHKISEENFHRIIKDNGLSIDGSELAVGHLGYKPIYKSCDLETEEVYYFTIRQFIMIVTFDKENLYIESIYEMRPDEVNIVRKVGVNMIDVLKVLFVISLIFLGIWYLVFHLF